TLIPSRMLLLLVLCILLLSFISTALQLITGLGFAMLTAPFAVVALGTHQGIMLTTVLAVIASLLMSPGMWRDIDWRRVAWIGIPAAVSVPPAAWIGSMIDTSIVYLLVGALVILGLSVALLMQGTTKPATGRGAKIMTVIGAGAGIVLAVIGGQAMTIYWVFARWS